MSKNLVCKSCGAPLAPDMEKCEYCKAANPAFVRPKVMPAEVYVKETPYVAPVETYAPSTLSNGLSFYEYASLPGKVALISLIPLAISLLYLALNSDLYISCFYGARGLGLQAGFILMIFIFGPLSGFWAVRGFLSLDSKWRKWSWLLWFVLQNVHLFLLGNNIPKIY